MHRCPHGLLLGLILLLPALGLAQGTASGQGGAEPKPVSNRGASAAGLPESLTLAVKRAERWVHQRRGLPRRRPIAMEVLGQEDLRARLAARLTQRTSDQAFVDKGAMWQLLGLLPRGLDLPSLLTQSLEPSVATVYEVADRRLLLAGFLPVKAQETRLIHETCRALLDQQVHVERLLRLTQDSTDAYLARLALVEGDCLCVTLEHHLSAQGLDLTNRQPFEALLDGLRRQDAGPAVRANVGFFEELRLFPYIEGARFVAGIRSRHPWSVVAQLYKHPPRSTEQILHPETYWKKKEPVRIRTKPLPPLAGYSIVRQDTLGEWVLGRTLARVLPPDGASRAVEGWAGDRLVALRSGAAGPMLLVHLTVWDSALDAREYENGQRHRFVADGLRPLPAEALPPQAYLDAEGRHWVIRRRGNQVLTLMALPAQLAMPVEQAVFALWRTSSPRSP